MKYSPVYIWAFWFAFFFLFEAIGIIYETKTGSDSWTLTHFVSRHLPAWARSMLIGWLAYHFLIQHTNS
jgi:hypothetical protein